MTEERWTYKEAKNRARSLRPILPAHWDVVPEGNREDGYRLGIQRDDAPDTAAWLASDEDMKRLLTAYIEQLEAVKA